MTTYAVTAVGPDAPGEVAALAEALAQLGANLEDASMTRLRGHFAMTVVVSTGAAADALETALTAASGLHVSVWPVDQDGQPPAPSRPWQITLHGADRPGIVAGVTRALAAHGANITDLTCRLVGDLYVMTIDVDAEQEPVLDGSALGVAVHVRPADEDVL
jgi:glycine cleavage system transcriptional repressor